MSTLLVKNAEVLVTMDEQRREIKNGGLFAVDGFITQVGRTESLPQTADRVLDCTGQIVLPGFVNTHHHLNQTLCRNVPAAQNANLFNWLKAHYLLWARITPESSRVSTLIGLAELALSGCTTVFDHSYIFKNGTRLDDQIEAAREIGVRFHASRGSMSLGESLGGLPPDSCVEEENFIVKDSQRLIETYHERQTGAMTQIALAPCSPFSVTTGLLRDSAAMARHYGVRLHTHLCETTDEQRFTLNRFKMRPVEWMESLGWLGDDVWFAHAVHVGAAEIARFAQTGCGLAHCPCSNMRLASGIAPVQAYLKAGVKVGLGVDGSASNDSSNMILEARQAMLLARLKMGMEANEALESGENIPEEQRNWMTARQALELATRGGASVLGRTDIGSLEVGKCADFFSLDLHTIGYAGALHDPVAAIIFCAPQPAVYTVIQGRVIVEQGQIVTMEMGPIIESQNRLSRQMVQVSYI